MAKIENAHFLPEQSACQEEHFLQSGSLLSRAPQQKFFPSQNRKFEKGLKKHSKLMGPEEIHICILEGAPRPPKSKCDRPKNLEVFLVNFQIRYLSHVVLFVFPMW